MVGGPYSPLKVFHHQDRIATLRRGEPIVPTQVQIFISDRCSHSCSFCAYRWEGYDSNELFGIVQPDGSVNNNPNRQIPYEKVIEILEDCKEMGVAAIQYTGGGEPTLHANCDDIFKYTLNLGLELALVTHGGHLTAKLCDTLTRPGSKWIRISIDAGTADTYARTRRIGVKAYRKTLDNVARLVEWRRVSGSKDPIIGIGFVVTNENWREVVDATITARDLGVNNIRISAVFQPDNEEYFEGFYQDAVDECHRAKELECDGFRVFNLFGDRLSDLRRRNPTHPFCGYQWFNTLIGGSLDVYRCCNTAYSPRGMLGSLKDQRLIDMWFSEETQDKLWDFDARQCPRCMFLGKLDTINYAIDPNQEHINFM